LPKWVGFDIVGVMKVWRLHSKGTIRQEKLEPIVPCDNSVKIKTSIMSLSNIDSMLFNGDIAAAKYPIILGHQAVGVISEIGEKVTNFERGERVVLDPYVFSGNSSQDTALEKMYGVDKDGFLSDFIIVNKEDCFKLPDRLKDEEAIFASHVALAVNIIAKLELNKGENLVILGASVVGIILAQLALYYQAVPILVDSRAERLLLAENFGIYYTINSGAEDVNKKVLAATGGVLADAAVYLSMHDLGLSKAFECVKVQGKVVVGGWGAASPEFKCSYRQAFSKQLSVFGVCTGAKQIPAAINMIANKSVKVKQFITNTVSFADVEKMMKEQASMKGRNIKTIIEV